jgi:hypothetical protein
MELQFLKFKAGAPNFYSLRPWDRFPKIVEFAYQICAMFGSRRVCQHLLSLIIMNKTHERSRLADMHLPSIVKVISARDLKPEIRALALNERYQISGKIL